MPDRSRSDWIATLFPSGIPRLWCPPLTHFQAPGMLARERTAAHLRHLAGHTRGWLVPGSTGEGWPMNDDQVRDVLAHALSVARRVDARVLVGVLRQDAASAIECIRETVDWLCRQAEMDDVAQALVSQHVCGFTVCPPTGAELTDEQIDDALRSILQLKFPTALYQLPQVTKNEIAPHIVAGLASDYPNLYLFKDTSGSDRVAAARVPLGDLVLVRGAEGRYASWLKSAGGPYDGFLLSTANVFADRLDDMIERIMRFDDVEARRKIEPVERAVAEVFERVSTLPWGNPFTNANKAIDHWMAFGVTALDHPAPMLYDGHVLPDELLEETRSILERHALLPEVGYLASA